MHFQSQANVEHVAKLLVALAASRDNTGGYPPAYGYLKPEAAGRFVESLTDADHILEPYTISVGIHGMESVYQLPRWTTPFDGGRSLKLFEYLPMGVPGASGERYTFSATLYTGSNAPHSGVLDEITAQRAEDRLRPFVYVPFNMKQLQIMRRWWTDQGDALGEQFDGADTTIAALEFPPSTYDAFVLIGNGPGGTDGGLTALDPPGTPGVDYDEHYNYQVLGLRIAFLATRDWTGGEEPGKATSPQPDQLLDFDFSDRRQAIHLCPLPDGTNGVGAMIKVVNSKPPVNSR